MKITWRMYSWHSAWYCQSHKPLLKNPLPQAPSSESYIPVLKEKKQPGEIRSYEQTTRPNICMSKVNVYCEIFLIWDLKRDTGGWGWTSIPELSFMWSWPILYAYNDDFYLSSHCKMIAERSVCLPGWMFSLIMLTCSSLSGRVCSCQNPITWPSSCTTIPNLSQFFPIDMAWGPPPRRPT